MQFRSIVLTLFVVTLLGCAEPVAAPPDSAKPRTIEDYRPKNSIGRKPAGTRDDPFVGLAVIKRIIPSTNGLVRVDLKRRSIPHFRVGGESGFQTPPQVLEGADEGDLVKLYYARLIEGSDTALAYAQALKTLKENPDQNRDKNKREPLPYVWFGYELFRIEKIPDSEAVSGSDKTKHRRGGAD